MADTDSARSPATRIKEHIVVEGRDDERAVKAAVDAAVIVTSGYGISRETWDRIRAAQARTGVIVFTDPDAAGDQIRRKINQRVPGCKNAYLTRADARRDRNIGVENAHPDRIRTALSQAQCTALDTKAPIYTLADLRHHRLVAHPLAARRREALGRHLAIGYANAKQFLQRLNSGGIRREQFASALAALPEDAERPPD